MIYIKKYFGGRGGGGKLVVTQRKAWCGYSRPSNESSVVTICIVSLSEGQVPYIYPDNTIMPQTARFTS